MRPEVEKSVPWSEVSTDSFPLGCSDKNGDCFRLFGAMLKTYTTIHLTFLFINFVYQICVSYRYPLLRQFLRSKKKSIVHKLKIEQKGNLQKECFFPKKMWRLCLLMLLLQPRCWDSWTWSWSPSNDRYLPAWLGEKLVCTLESPHYLCRPSSLRDVRRTFHFSFKNICLLALRWYVWRSETALGDYSLLLPCHGVWGLNSGCQARMATAFTCWSSLNASPRTFYFQGFRQILSTALLF